MDIPSVVCSLKFEKICPKSKNVLTTDNMRSVSISLLRNQYQDLVLNVEGKAQSRKVLVRQATLAIHRKFVKEGKLTLDVQDQGLRVLFSNAPPHQLVQFVKSLAAKLAGNHLKPVMSVRERLMSNLPSVTQDISPVTLKDVQSLKLVEKGPNGLLKTTLESPVSSQKKKTLKRSRLVAWGKENANITQPDPSSPRLAGRFKSQLTPEQRRVLEVVKSGQSVFFTGGAGVGKSFLIKKIIGSLPPESTFVTASTGVAAYHIGGITLHSFAGIGDGQMSLEQTAQMAKTKRRSFEVWRKCQHLIIDEISMVEGSFFDKLEAVARAARGSEQPFGGIQLIVAGDFLQLPPVSKGSAGQRQFCFQAQAWSQSIKVVIELKTVKRQNDPKFIEILNALRLGQCSKEATQILQATATHDIAQHGIVPTKLCTHTQQATNINQSELARLEGALRQFNAVDSDPSMSNYLDSHLPPAQAKLELKVGAQVMLTKNLKIHSGLVNGARGRVVAFESASGWPVVQFLAGAKATITLERWTVRAYGGNVVVRKQLPLKLAWAFSIHKSQGMTLDCVEMCLSRVFECGQAYVALSRAKNLESIRILDFSSKCIQADPNVVTYYQSLVSA